MKKLACLVLTVLCLLGSLPIAQAMEIPKIQWEFPVPLTDVISPYALLVNEDNPLDADYKPKSLEQVKGVKRATSAAVSLEKTAAEALKKFFEAAALVTEYTYVDEKGREKVATYGEKGMVLFLKSGYRSYGTQSTTYTNYLARNNNVDDGYVAKPGASEHQTGICADILNADYAGRPRMTQDFKWTPEAQWMKENCAEYGFILRFTEDGEAKTGIKFEPWHFRYVGKNIASYVMGKGITLEQFTQEAQEAYEALKQTDFDEEEWLEYEYLKLNAPPASYVLDEYDDQGDAEISLVF